MITGRLILAIAVLGLNVGASSPRPDYAEGQVWEYQTRPGDEESLLRIQKIGHYEDPAPQEPIYHVSIIGIHFSGLPLAGELQHAPVSRQSLDASVTRLSSSSAAFPDPNAGIAEWRAAEGGVFTIPIADVVAFVEQTVRQQLPQ